MYKCTWTTTAMTTTTTGTCINWWKKDHFFSFCSNTYLNKSGEYRIWSALVCDCIWPRDWISRSSPSSSSSWLSWCVCENKVFYIIICCIIVHREREIHIGFFFSSVLYIFDVVVEAAAAEEKKKKKPPHKHTKAIRLVIKSKCRTTYVCRTMNTHRHHIRT